jgi:hypothetical protein
MNVNLLNIINRIVAEQGEGILADAKRLFPYFSDYAKNESKEERVAFGRCIEMGAYQELKRTRAPDERLRVKATLANQMNAKTGIDWKQCADALDLLEAVLFKTQQQFYPPQTQPQYSPQPSYPQPPQYPSQPQYPSPPQPHPQSSSPAVKKTKSKKPVIIAAAAVVTVVILAVVIIANIKSSNMPLWEGYESFEDFARAAEINNILPVGPLDEKGFYVLMGGAFVGHALLEPIIKVLFAGIGIDVTITADFDLINSAKLSKKYHVPPELRQNYNYLVRRIGIEGSKTYLALRFDSERVFGVFIPYSGWIVMVYEEGAFIK